MIKVPSFENTKVLRWEVLRWEVDVLKFYERQRRTLEAETPPLRTTAVRNQRAEIQSFSCEK
jgi:hypothetical protein